MWNTGRKSFRKRFENQSVRIRQFCLLSLLLSVIVLARCVPRCTPHSSQLPECLLNTIDSFYSAIENDNHEDRIALFTEDAIMLPNHGSPMRGKDTIAAVVRSGEGWTFRIRNRFILDAHISGGMAYTVNAYEYTTHRQGETPQWHKTKNVHIWRKDLQGAWKLHVDIWNSDVPLGTFDSE